MLSYKKSVYKWMYNAQTMQNLANTRKTLTIPGHCSAIPKQELTGDRLDAWAPRHCLQVFHLPHHVHDELLVLFKIVPLVQVWTLWVMDLPVDDEVVFQKMFPHLYK